MATCLRVIRIQVFISTKLWCFIDNNERTLETFNFKKIALNVYIVSTTPRCYNFCQTLLVIQLSDVYTYFFLFFFRFLSFFPHFYQCIALIDIQQK